MKTWSVRAARAGFSGLLEACVAEGPQMVTREGTEIAILIALEAWRRLLSSVRPTMKELLMSNVRRTVSLTPSRRPVWRRKNTALA
jgi:prevent-host-death family protein